MCGIAGIYSFDPRPNRGDINKNISDMTNALQSRGPDGHGIWQDHEIPLALGHRRLSILDLSPSGHQPMKSQSGRYIVTYNGEIYNFKTLRKELETTHGVVFTGGSDTEVLLSCIEFYGFKKTLEKINGMFAFALWDHKEKMLYLARDRFGKKPLYIGWAGSNLLFASELKSFCTHPDFSRDVDRNSLTSYMRFGYVPAPLCIYKQVWQLPAGVMMAININMIRSGQELKSLMSSYWSHKDALVNARANPIDNTDNIVDEFEELLSTCVRDRMVSDVPLGAFLSGGIDSSAIVALMQKNSAKPVKTYTIGFDETGFNEAVYAKKISAHLGTDHHEVYLSAKDSLDVLSDLPDIYDEPFADSSAIPTYLVSKFARKSVTVALSGDGGDEMLCGYERYLSGAKAWNIIQNIPTNLRSPLSQMLTTISPKTWNKLRPNNPQFGSHIYKFASILDKKCAGDAYMSFISQWQKPKQCVIDGSEGLIPLVDPDIQIDDLNFSEEMMYWDSLSYLNGDILTKVDRASMAVSLEVRAPLLDHRIYDFAWKLPMEYKLRGGKGKWILRQVLNKHVPAELFERPKQGFGVPIAQWLREDLKDWAEDLLDEYELREQGLLNYKLINTMWEEHKQGRGHHVHKLWTVLMFQAWHRRWIKA